MLWIVNLHILQLGHAVRFYVKSLKELYNQLRHFERPLCLFDSSSGEPVQIFGSKGVGKSTCLYALALQMIISTQTQDNLKILYFTEDSGMDGLQTVNAYLQSSGLDCTFDKVVQTIIICLDYGQYNNGGLNQFVHLFNNMSSHIRIIVAHVGNGPFYSSTQDLSFYTFLENFAVFPTHRNIIISTFRHIGNGLFHCSP